MMLESYFALWDTSMIMYAVGILVGIVVGVALSVAYGFELLEEERT
jgi:hypothetical protein